MHYFYVMLQQISFTLVFTTNLSYLLSKYASLLFIMDIILNHHKLCFYDHINNYY